MENEQVDFMGNNLKPKNNPYSNNYNPIWRNHPNFFWYGQENQRSQPILGFQQPYQQVKKSNLEEMLAKFISMSETRFQNTDTTLRNQQAFIQGLENHISQFSKLISERQKGSVPSNIETT